MLVVVALGGNALLRRGEKPDAETQLVNVKTAARAIAELAQSHQLVITHGNGPQVGMLAVESENDAALSRPYPLDVLGAETDGMIGYWLEQELGNQVPGSTVATLLTRTLVDADDPAFADPTKFIGAVYDETTAQQLAAGRDWTVKRDGQGWRRVVPSPLPRDIVELPVIELLVRNRAIVICAGGGGIPVLRRADGALAGVEAVVDKDRVSALLASRLDADALLLLTDVAAVEADWGTPRARPIHQTTPQELRSLTFAAGSMGPKVEAACEFVECGGRLAGIGTLQDAAEILSGTVGTRIRSDAHERTRPK